METRSVPATPLQYGRHPSSIVDASVTTPASASAAVSGESDVTGTNAASSSSYIPSRTLISGTPSSTVQNVTPHVMKVPPYVIQSVSAPVTPAIYSSATATGDSVTSTPAAAAGSSYASQPSATITPALPPPVTAAVQTPIDSASLLLLQQRVEAERKKMTSLLSSVEKLKQSAATPSMTSPAATGSGTPASTVSSIATPSSSAAPHPPPRPSSGVKPSPTSLHGRPPVSFSPSPTGAAGTGTLAYPLNQSQATPSQRTSAFPSTTPLSPIEEKSSVIQNLNESFASVASGAPSPDLKPAASRQVTDNEAITAAFKSTVDFPPLATAEQKVAFSTPSHPPAPSMTQSSPAVVSLSASPNLNSEGIASHLHPRSTPSPATLKSIIASQRENMQRAGVYGEQLLSEIDLLQAENEQLKSQVQSLQSQAQLTTAQAVTLKAMSEFMRAEFLAANTSRRSCNGSDIDPSASKAFQFTGQFGADFNTFQNLLRQHRKSMRDLHESVDSHRDQLERLQNEHEISQRNLIQTNQHSQHLASEVNRLQQERDVLDIEVSTLQTKSKHQYSQHQCETHVLQEQLASLKEDAHNELEKLKEEEFEKRQQLEHQIGGLKLTVQRLESAATAESFNEAVSQHLMSPIPKLSVSSGPQSSSKTAAKTPMLATQDSSSSTAGTVSLASDLVTAIEPESIVPSGPRRDELEHLIRLEKDRRDLRESWAAEEQMWYLERLRLRELERQAAEMRQEEAIAETKLLEQSRENHYSEESEQEWKEKVSKLQHEIRTLQQSHEKSLDKAIAVYTKQLLEKEDEVAELRQQLKTSIAMVATATATANVAAVSASSASSGSALLAAETAVGSSLDPDALSTPMLQRTARGETSHVITPPLSHFRNSLQSHHNRHANSAARELPHSAGSKGVPSDSRFSQFDTPFTPFTHSPISSVSSSTSGLSLDLSQTTEMLSDLQSDLQTSSDRTQETLQQVSSEVKVSGNSTRRLFTILFCLQILATGAWLLLTSGGSTELLDHPLMQAVLLFADRKSLSDVSALFMA